jgi:hypothetical protein
VSLLTKGSCPSPIMGAEHPRNMALLAFRSRFDPAATFWRGGRRTWRKAMPHRRYPLRRLSPVHAVTLQLVLAFGHFTKVLLNCSARPLFTRPCVQQVANRTLMSLPNRRIATSQSGFIECAFKFRHGICVAITKLSTDESKQQEPLLRAINRFSCEEIP